MSTVSLKDLQALAASLSPTFQVALADVPGIVAALAQVAEHGQPLVDAAHEGAQAVADFYHDKAVAAAQAAGTEAPRKGQPVATGPVSTPGGVSVSAGVDAAAIQAAVQAGIQQALAAIQAGQVKVSAPAADAGTAPAPAQDETAPAPHPSAEPTPATGAE